MSEQEKTDKYISYSQLSKQSECKHLHWLESISKLKKRTANQYSAYGLALEDTLEKIFIETALGDRKEHEDQDYFHDFLEQEIELVEEIDPELLIKQYEAGTECIKNFESEFNKKFKNYELVETQKKIKKKLPHSHPLYNFIFYGIIDLVIRHNNKIIIIDYKTTNKGWSSYALQDSLKLMQFYLYKLFYLSIKGNENEDIECCYIFFNTTTQKIEIKMVPVTDDDMTWVYTKIGSFIYNAYEKLDYSRNAVCGKYCGCQDYVDAQKKLNNNTKQEGINNV